MTKTPVAPIKNHKALLSNIERSSIPCLGRVHVKDGYASTNDMDFMVSVPTTLEDGMYYHEGFDAGLYIKSPEDIADFPVFDIDKDYENHGEITLDAHMMRAVDFVGKFMSTEETRYYLNGICLYDDHMVATNGHGMNIVRIPYKFEGRPIIPRKAIKIIKMLFKETRANSASLTIYAGSRFHVSIAGCQIIGKLIDGTFPDYTRVVPDVSRTEKRGDFSLDEFKNILPQVRAVAKINKSKSKGVAIDDGVVSPAFDHANTGVKWSTSLDIKIGFNIDYMMHLCSGKYSYIDQSSPFMVEGNDFEGQKSILMPLRVW